LTRFSDYSDIACKARTRMSGAPDSGLLNRGLTRKYQTRNRMLVMWVLNHWLFEQVNLFRSTFSQQFL